MENTKTEIKIENQISGLEIATEGLRRASENGNTSLMWFYLSMVTKYTNEVSERIVDFKKGEI